MTRTWEGGSKNTPSLALVVLVSPEALKLPLKVGALCEVKKRAVKFLQYRWGPLCRDHGTHIFDGNEVLLDSKGPCHLHSQECKVPPPPDIVCAGLPCKAFSRLRVRAGGTNKTSGPQNHPAFGPVQDFVSYLAKRRPGVWWVEEVESFNSITGKGQVRTHLEEWCQQVTAIGYSVRVLRFQHQDWVLNRRSRLLIVGCSRQHGGALGAQWIFDAMQRVVARRQIQRPVSVWELVDPNCIE